MSYSRTYIQLEQVSDVFASMPVPHLHGIVEYQALINPKATALISSDETATFEQINRQANQLARELSALGVEHGDRVVMICIKSIAYIIAQLAVLKLGAVFVPLSVDLPLLRVKAVIDNAQPSLVLVDNPKAEIKTVVAKVFKVKDLLRQSIARQISNLNVTVHAGDSAWLIYTSGSTGTPKGVEGTHLSSLWRCGALQQMQRVDEGEVFAHLMPTTSIDCIWEVWGPMLFTRPIVLLELKKFRQPEELVSALEEFQVSQICLVPSYLRTLLTTCGEQLGNLTRLKTWVSTGEFLPQQTVSQFFQHLPAAKLINQYGLTESTATTSHFSMIANSSQHSSAGVPLGEALAGTRLYVLDKHLEPVKPSQKGELYIAGLCLASGYRNLASVTAEKFLPDPFASDGSRFYRSGDIVSQDPEGIFYFHGRADRRAKILGHRVELEEIETAMLSISDIVKAAVVTDTNEHGEVLLLGFYCCAQGVDHSGKDYRKQLAAVLPDYMLPVSLFCVSQMPLMNSGKVDYQKLRELAFRANKELSPTDHKVVRETLRQMWSSILELDMQDFSANFFELGGTSTAAIRMIHGMRKTFEIKVLMEDIYTSPTIDQLTELVVSRSQVQEPVDKVVK